MMRENVSGMDIELQILCMMRRMNPSFRGTKSTRIVIMLMNDLMQDLLQRTYLHNRPGIWGLLPMRLIIMV
jgi:hypothetical protein